MGNREALLAAAERCLRSRGYSATTARDLAGEAGTSLAAIGYHFGSKEALLNQAMTACWAGWAERLGQKLLSLAGGTVEEVLAGLLPAVYEAIEADRDILMALFDALGQIDRSAELHRQLVAQYEESRALTGVLVAGLLKTSTEDPAARALASLVVAVLDGLAVQYILDPSSVPDGEAIPAVVARISEARGD